jgi:ABC-type glutathione transport system ATPase component
MRVSRLHVSLDQKVLVEISFSINSSLALVGQSGSGKSLTLKALLGMLPQKMECKLDFESEFKLHAGDTISLVPQNPFTALSPLTKIKKQFFCTKERMEELFLHVGLDNSLLDRYPPELSGGQLQRVVIAMALECKPKLLMLDEPTTALDPQTRIKILELLKNLQSQMGFLILFVSHDMFAASALCQEICVIKDGLVVEAGMMQEVVEKPKESYTKTLIEASFAHRKFRQ